MLKDRLRAHPRSRGENRPRSRASNSHAGSSPLTRGKPDGHEGRVVDERLIPAHAGKTKGRASPRAKARAHPRSRGENRVACGLLPALGGSSPLTRGKRVERGANLVHVRLIPAHAGKTYAAEDAGVRPGAHPRSRGENRSNCIASLAAHGSSPLTRGKRSPVYPAGHARGLIPAHAGKTRQRRGGASR